ncbi:hypothetical protein [Lentzea roselyniae]|uniref:hypothetical protein n=1 Tax=Lentzea roselyniae TaxID=531940 RepID=UPI0031F74843
MTWTLSDPISFALRGTIFTGSPCTTISRPPSSSFNAQAAVQENDSRLSGSFQQPVVENEQCERAREPFRSRENGWMIGCPQNLGRTRRARPELTTRR